MGEGEKEGKRKIQTGGKEAVWCGGKMLNQALDPCSSPPACVSYSVCDLDEIPELPWASIQMRGGLDGVSYVWTHSGPVLVNCWGAKPIRGSWNPELGMRT